MILKPVTLETLPVNYVLHRKIRISAQAEAGRHICLSLHNTDKSLQYHDGGRRRRG